MVSSSVAFNSKYISIRVAWVSDTNIDPKACRADLIVYLVTRRMKLAANRDFKLTVCIQPSRHGYVGLTGLCEL